jgi:periplasmic divalent cation tolerance protein
MAATLLYVTSGSEEEALRIGRTLVEARLAACANVVPGTTSVYWWEGAVQQEAEALLIVKTRAALVETVTARIQALHSYDCPCVLALPIAGGHQPFLDWIEEETRSAAG